MMSDELRFCGKGEPPLALKVCEFLDEGAQPWVSPAEDLRWARGDHGISGR